MEIEFDFYFFTGRITIGSAREADIALQGTGVEPLHCHIENSNGVVTLYPLAEMTSVDGLKVTIPTRLTQGILFTLSLVFVNNCIVICGFHRTVI